MGQAAPALPGTTQPGTWHQRLVARWWHWRPAPTAQRELIVALLLAACYGFFVQQPAWNEYSRFDLIVAMVNDRTLHIDRYHENTGDKALFDGHYYSDKVPGSALLGIPPYALIRVVAHLSGVGQPNPELTVAVIAFTVSGIPTILLVLLLARCLRPVVGEVWALAMALGYGLGSLSFPFATMLFGHAASTCFAFAAFFVLWQHGARGRAGPYLLAGLLLGWAVLTDLPAAIVAIALLPYAWSRDRRGPLLIGIGALPAAALLGGYNWLAFGAPWSIGYANLASGSFADGMGRGLLGVTLPQPEVLRDLLIGGRGLLRLSPWFALAPLGLLAARRPELRREVIICSAVTLAFLFVNAGYYLPFGGWTPGPRFLLPALPFAMILVSLAPSAFRPLIALQLVLATALTTIATATMPNAREAVAEPLRDLWLPRLLAQQLAETTSWVRWGLHGVQPLLLLGVIALLALALLYATTQTTARWRRTTRAGLVLLIALVVATCTPIESASGLSLPLPPPGETMQISAAGATLQQGAEKQFAIELWGQIANGRSGQGGTEVRFVAVSPTGEEIWSAWYGDVAWREGERKRFALTWSPATPAAEDYRFRIRVTANGGRTLLAQRDFAP